MEQCPLVPTAATSPVQPDVVMATSGSASSSSGASSWEWADEPGRGRAKGKGKRGKNGSTTLQAKREAARRASSLGLRKVRTPDKTTTPSASEDVRERSLALTDKPRGNVAESGTLACIRAAQVPVPVSVSPTEAHSSAIAERTTAGAVRRLKEEISAPIATWMGRTVSAEEHARLASSAAANANNTAVSAGVRAETAGANAEFAATAAQAALGAATNAEAKAAGLEQGVREVVEEVRRETGQRRNSEQVIEKELTAMQNFAKSNAAEVEKAKAELQTRRESEEFLRTQLLETQSRQREQDERQREQDERRRQADVSQAEQMLLLQEKLKRLEEAEQTRRKSCPDYESCTSNPSETQPPMRNRCQSWGGEPARQNFEKFDIASDNKSGSKDGGSGSSYTEDEWEEWLTEKAVACVNGSRGIAEFLILEEIDQAEKLLRRRIQTVAESRPGGHGEQTIIDGTVYKNTQVARMPVELAKITKRGGARADQARSRPCGPFGGTGSRDSSAGAEPQGGRGYQQSPGGTPRNAQRANLQWRGDREHQNAMSHGGANANYYHGGGGSMQFPPGLGGGYGGWGDGAPGGGGHGGWGGGGPGGGGGGLFNASDYVNEVPFLKIDDGVRGELVEIDGVILGSVGIFKLRLQTTVEGDRAQVPGGKRVSPRLYGRLDTKFIPRWKQFGKAKHLKEWACYLETTVGGAIMAPPGIAASDAVLETNRERLVLMSYIWEECHDDKEREAIKLIRLIDTTQPETWTFHNYWDSLVRAFPQLATALTEHINEWDPENGKWLQADKDLYTELLRYNTAAENVEYDLHLKCTTIKQRMLALYDLKPRASIPEEVFRHAMRDNKTFYPSFKMLLEEAKSGKNYTTQAKLTASKKKPKLLAGLYNLSVQAAKLQSEDPADDLPEQQCVCELVSDADGPIGIRFHDPAIQSASFHKFGDREQPTKGRKVCFNCGKEGHIRSECTQPKACWICGGTDHLKANCKQKTTAVHLGRFVRKFKRKAHSRKFQRKGSGKGGKGKGLQERRVRAMLSFFDEDYGTAIAQYGVDDKDLTNLAAAEPGEENDSFEGDVGEKAAVMLLEGIPDDIIDEEGEDEEEDEEASSLFP
eukprot:g13867.t1